MPLQSRKHEVAFGLLPFPALLHGFGMDPEAEAAQHAFFFFAVADSLTIAHGAGETVLADSPDAGALGFFCFGSAQFIKRAVAVLTFPDKLRAAAHAPQAVGPYGLMRISFPFAQLVLRLSR